jgi:hypothetical protein
VRAQSDIEQRDGRILGDGPYRLAVQDNFVAIQIEITARGLDADAEDPALLGFEVRCVTGARRRANGKDKKQVPQDASGSLSTAWDRLMVRTPRLESLRPEPARIPL